MTKNIFACSAPTTDKQTKDIFLMDFLRLSEACLEPIGNMHIKLANKFTTFSPFKVLFSLIKMLETLHPKLFKHHHLKTALLGRLISQEVFTGPYASQYGQMVVRACLLHHLGLFLSAGGDISNYYMLQPHKLFIDKNQQNKNIQNSFLLGSTFLRGQKDTVLSTLSPIIYGCAFPWQELKKQQKELPKLTNMVITASSITHIASRVSLFCAVNEVVGNIQTQILKDIKYCAQQQIIDPDVANITQSLLTTRSDIWLDLEYPEKWETDILHLSDHITTYTSENIYNFFFTLTDIIESRSPCTKDHTLGVATAANIFAQEIGASMMEAQEIKLAAIMHDIGKIAIPLNILHKQDKLTDDEWKKIKEHVYLPYLNMKDIFPPELQCILTTAALHHERLDGSGYPWGLKHRSIPIGARILQIADVFSALLEHRPYKKPMSLRETIAILQTEIRNGKLWNGVPPQAFYSAYETLTHLFPHLKK